MENEDCILNGHWEPLDECYGNMDWDPDGYDTSEDDPQNDADAVTD